MILDKEPRFDKEKMIVLNLFSSINQLKPVIITQDIKSLWAYEKIGRFLDTSTL